MSRSSCRTVVTYPDIAGRVHNITQPRSILHVEYRSINMDIKIMSSTCITFIYIYIYIMIFVLVSGLLLPHHCSFAEQRLKDEGTWSSEERSGFEAGPRGNG